MNYEQLCEELFVRLEEYLDDHSAEPDYESNGLICEITMAGGSKLVINRQPPLQEIWLAAKSGGYHFRHADGQWCDTRDNTEFFTRLGTCLAAQE